MLELSALVEQNPKDVHYDDWPTFDLYEATVTSPKSDLEGGLIDLLDVLEKGPFTVKGRIRSYEKHLAKFVRNDNLTKTEIIIANVRRWSIERLEDDGIIIWALGNAAWYGIHPSKEYEPIYDEMLQKAAIYNFIVDKYGAISSKGPPFRTSMDAIYSEMASAYPQLGSKESCKALVLTHRRFIIAQLLENEAFSRTPFWKFMKERYGDEIEEVSAVIKKVTLEIQNAAEKKAQRLSRSPPEKGPGSPKRPTARTRSGTASSNASDAGLSSKRKSKGQPSEEPGSRRRKTSDDSGRATPEIRLAQKTRKSARVLSSSASISPPPTAQHSPPPPIIQSQERLVLSGRTTRSTVSPQEMPSSPLISSNLLPPALSILLAPTELKPVISPAPIEKPAAPPIPKPSVNTLKEVIRSESQKSPPKSNAVAASKLSRLPGTRQAKKQTVSPPSKKSVTKSTSVGIMAGSSGILRQSTRSKQKAPAPGVVPLDENHPGYDDLRDQAIAKLTQLHSLYQKISKTENRTDYQKFVELVDENAEWRRQHMLKPIYIDVLYNVGYYTDEIKDSSMINRVPDTEYLVDSTDWDFATAAELLQNVNRGTYFQELLQPVKETRRNARLRGGRGGKGHARTATPQEIEASMSTLKISSKPSGVSIKDGQKEITTWKCPGHDSNGNFCTFEVENATNPEAAKKSSDHWRTCSLRQIATEEALEKKKANIEQAQTVLMEQQVRDPWTNVDHLVNWIEAEANKSRSWFPAGVC